MPSETRVRSSTPLKLNDPTTTDILSEFITAPVDISSGVEGDKDTNHSENTSHVLDHSVSHISHESDQDKDEALYDTLFWAAAFDRIVSPEEDAEPAATHLTH